jgi:nucleotide-binding universal stress UspA family protein
MSAMHILIATDGHLDAGKATEMVARLFRPDDAVTVLTALDHPRRFLQGYAETAGVAEVATIAHEAGAGVIGFASGARAAERLAPLIRHQQPEKHPPGLSHYFAETARRRVGILIDRLKEAGIVAEAAWTTTDSQTADSVLDAAERAEADVLIVGSHGRRGLEGVLGSTATKLVRQASIPVMVIP